MFHSINSFALGKLKALSKPYTIQFIQGFFLLFQADCLETTECLHFTFFEGNRRCTLFKSCTVSNIPCSDCFTGHKYRELCLENNVPTLRRNNSLYHLSNGLEEHLDGDLIYRVKRSQDSDNDVNIDDGLLDDVFDDNDEPGNRRKSTNKERRRPTKSGRPEKTDESFYCLMGGGNERGAISRVSVMNVGTYSVPRQPLISPYPEFMTRGSGFTFSTYSPSSGLHTCTPPYLNPHPGFSFHTHQVKRE